MSVTFTDSSEEFIEKINKALGAGYGFVPLIGTGVSAPSGVPIIREICAYLRRCLWLAMPVDHGPASDGRLDPRKDPALDRPWNPRTDCWPALDASEFNRRNGDEMLRNLLHLRRIETPNDYPLLDLLQQALGAAPDWRSSLLLLSRLQLDWKRHEVSLGAPDNRVIDLFFKHILDGKSPTLCHLMLAQLADRMRLNILLTTNFDDLMEQAFRERGSLLTTFDVHEHGQLPAVELLQGFKAFVKLHGGRHVRADYSLDSIPSSDDLRHFVSYLAGGFEIDETVGAAVPLRARNHLLVLGTSTSDLRIKAMIKNAWKLVPNVKIFWVCHSRNDQLRATSFGEELMRLIPKEAELPKEVELKREFIGIQHSSLGLLLLELYQHLHQALPPTGIPFPAAARISVPPLITSIGKAEQASIPFQELANNIQTKLEDVKTLQEHRVVTVTSDKEVVGVTSAASEVFQRLTDKGMECVWLDLDDIVSADDLFEHILESVTTRAGVPDWVPMVQSTDVKSRGAVLRHATSHQGKEWVLFLNARETPGVNLAYDPENIGNTTPLLEGVFDTNGWLDYNTDSASKPVRELYNALMVNKLIDSDPLTITPQQAFLHLLKDVTGAECKNVSCVLLCRGIDQVDQVEAKGDSQDTHTVPILRSVDAHLNLISALTANGFDRTIIARESLIAYEVEATVKIVRELATTENRPFLLPLVLMRRTRYLATIASPAFAELKIPVWKVAMDKLETFDNMAPGFVRRKPGGFIWLHCRFRDQVRDKYAISGQETNKDDWYRILTETYWGLAEWCERLHLSTESPTAAFEAIYFALQSATSALQPLAGTAECDDVACHCRRVFSLIDRALSEADTRIMYLGFSKGRCRRLLQLRELYVTRVADLANGLPDAQKHLKEYIIAECHKISEKCLKMESKIAREVAEHRTGYRRQRDLRILLVQKSPNKDPVTETPLIEINSVIFANSVRDSNPTAWFDWWRHVGTLGIASRSYERAQSAFKRALRPNFLDCDPNEIVGKVLKQCPGRESETNRMLLAVAKVFARKLQLDVAKCKVKQRLTDDDSGDSLDTLCEIAINDYDCARQLLGAIHSHLWFEIRNSWRRIDTYRALVETCKSNRDFGIAKRFLNSAERQTLQFDPGRSSIARAVIELHRADVSLSQAQSRPPCAQSCSGGQHTFGEWRQELLRHNVDVHLRTSSNNQEIRKLVERHSPLGFRSVQGILQDALSALDRARPILLQHERNVWWSTWYFERRIKAIELMLWATVGDKGGRIPFLGLEAASSVTGTIVDELLDDAERMVRYDVYRLATVVECYLNCLLALRVRLCCDDGPTTDRLVSRQNAMNERLTRAERTLRTILKARQNMSTNSSMNDINNYALAEGVRQYVENVCKQAEDVVEKTLDPIRWVYAN